MQVTRHICPTHTSICTIGIAKDAAKTEGTSHKSQPPTGAFEHNAVPLSNAHMKALCAAVAALRPATSSTTSTRMMPAVQPLSC